MKKIAYFSVGLLLSLLMLCHTINAQKVALIDQFGSIQLNYPLTSSVFRPSRVFVFHETLLKNAEHF